MVILFLLLNVYLQSPLSHSTDSALNLLCLYLHFSVFSSCGCSRDVLIVPLCEYVHYMHYSMWCVCEICLCVCIETLHILFHLLLLLHTGTNSLHINYFAGRTVSPFLFTVVTWRGTWLLKLWPHSLIYAWSFEALLNLRPFSIGLLAV